MGAAQNPWELFGIHGKCWGSMGTAQNPWKLLRIHGKCWESMGAAQNPWESLRIHGKWSEFMENVEDPWEPLRIHGNFLESMDSPQHPWELLFLSPFWHFSPNSPFPSSNPIFFSHFPSTRSSLSRHRIPGNFPMDGFNCLGFCPFLVFSLDTFAHLGSVWNLAQAGKNVKKMNCSD